MDDRGNKKETAAQRSQRIERMIIESLAAGHDKDLVTYVAVELDLTRQAVFLHVRRLIDQELITASGKTKNRRYELNETTHEETINITPDIEEHIIWEKHMKPFLPDLRKDIHDICFHGFTEIFNNVKDHSDGSICKIQMTHSASNITLVVEDNGVGIFNKLQKQFGFEDEHHAALELAKGKLTTDRQRHSGEGIFFTSRMFDVFAIFSRGFVFLHEKNDWLVRTEEKENTLGTSVSMSINLNSPRTTQSVFDDFAVGDDYGFVRTMVPIKLAKYGGENLVSRSQAKRVLARLENFQIALLDFKDVETIGQAFADEIFRVFNLTHPGVRLEIANANSRVNKMIEHVWAQ